MKPSYEKNIIESSSQNSFFYYFLYPYKEVSRGASKDLFQKEKFHQENSKLNFDQFKRNKFYENKGNNENNENNSNRKTSQVGEKSIPSFHIHLCSNQDFKQNEYTFHIYKKMQDSFFSKNNKLKDDFEKTDIISIFVLKNPLEFDLDFYKIVTFNGISPDKLEFNYFFKGVNINIYIKSLIYSGHKQGVIIGKYLKFPKLIRQKYWDPKIYEMLMDSYVQYRLLDDCSDLETFSKPILFRSFNFIDSDVFASEAILYNTGEMIEILFSKPFSEISSLIQQFHCFFFRGI